MSKTIKNPNNKIPKRQFLGKLNDFKSRSEKVFNQRMLKAYLKGHINFTCNGREHIVLQKYNTITS